MRRIKLVVAYDGTNYCGWQIQKNGITIESELNRHLSTLLQEEVRVIGASRTDSGVHALGNVAVFDTESQIPAEKVAYALNARLPEDIRIQDSCEVPSSFHPRYDARKKTYEYRILNRKFAIPQYRYDSFFYYRPLDLAKMQQAARWFLGEHDFAGFCSANSQANTTVRTIYDINVKKEKSMITIRVTGNGFLYNMIRIIVGTLIEVGLSNIKPEVIPDIIASCDREAAGPTAVACGLTLIEISYFPL